MSLHTKWICQLTIKDVCSAAYLAVQSIKQKSTLLPYLTPYSVKETARPEKYEILGETFLAQKLPGETRADINRIYKHTL